MRRTLMIALVAVGLSVGGLGLYRVAAQDHAKMPPPPKRAVQLQQSIDKYKTELTKQGKYSCCVAPGCDFCVTRMGMCPCGQMAAADKPVCRECKGGWEAGEGIIGGKRAADIKAMPAKMK